MSEQEKNDTLIIVFVAEVSLLAGGERTRHCGTLCPLLLLLGSSTGEVPGSMAVPSAQSLVPCFLRLNELIKSVFFFSFLNRLP